MRELELYLNNYGLDSLMQEKKKWIPNPQKQRKSNAFRKLTPKQVGQNRLNSIDSTPYHPQCNNLSISYLLLRF